MRDREVAGVPRAERALDEGDSPLLKFAADLRKLREKAGSPVYRELSKRAHYSVAVLSEAAGGRKLPTLAVTLAYVAACDGDTEAWEKRWHEVAATEAPPKAGKQAQSPYPGLSAFQVDDAKRFFGRDRLVAELVGAVRGRRFVGVFGASGSGKSSLLRAGLVATMAAEGVPTAVITPGAHPVVPVVDEELLLVVDQFEEVFTLCADRAEREEFISALVHSPARVALGIRADFFAQCVEHPELREALRPGQVLVGPMTSDELRQAIVRPATENGYTVDSALVSRLIADASGQPGVLPLVAHVLRETWLRRQDMALTLAAYEAAGGIHYAIARTAETVYTDFDHDRQAVIRQIFLRLTALGEGTEDTKRRISPAELDTTQGTETVLAELARARLVTVDRDSIEITHEALISHWPRLREWLTDDRDGLRLHRQLTEAADTWHSLDHDPDLLYRGTRLALTLDWLSRTRTPLSRREQEFFDAGVSARLGEEVAARRRTRRLRAVVALLSVLLVMVAASTVIAIHAQQVATQQRNLALAQAAVGETTALRAGNPDLAGQLALAAYRLAPTTQTGSSLISVLSDLTAGSVQGITQTARLAVLSGDGRMLAAYGPNQTIIVFNLSDPHNPRELGATPAQLAVSALAFSRDGGMLAARTLNDSASTSATAVVKVWSLADPRQPASLAQFDSGEDFPGTVGFSPDGRTLTAGGDQPASSGNVLRLWDVSDIKVPRQLTPIPSGSLAPTYPTGTFSVDGKMLAVYGTHADVRLYGMTDPAHPVPLGTVPNDSGYTNANVAAFSPDARLMAVSEGTDTGVATPLRLFDVSDPRHPVRLAQLADQLTGSTRLAFSPDGHRMLTDGLDYAIRVWDLADPRHPSQLAVLSAFNDQVQAVRFGADSTTLLAFGGAGAGQLVRTFNLDLPNAFSGLCALSGSSITRQEWDQYLPGLDYAPPC